MRKFSKNISTVQLRRYIIFFSVNYEFFIHVVVVVFSSLLFCFVATPIPMCIVTTTFFLYVVSFLLSFFPYFLIFSESFQLFFQYCSIFLYIWFLFSLFAIFNHFCFLVFMKRKVLFKFCFLGSFYLFVVLCSVLDTSKIYFTVTTFLSLYVLRLFRISVIVVVHT